MASSISKDQIRAALVKQGTAPEKINELLGMPAMPTGVPESAPPARFDGETDEEFTARTAPIERGQLFAPSGPAPAAPWEGEGQEEFAARTAPVENGQLFAPSGPSPKFAPSAPIQGDPAAVMALRHQASGPSPATPPPPKRNPDRLDNAIALIMRGAR